MSTGTRYLATLGALIALVAASFGSVSHQAETTHVVCEHGEVVHVGSTAGEVASAGELAGARAVPGRGGDAGHEHCHLAVPCSQRQLAGADIPREDEPAATVAVFPRERLDARRSLLLLAAPKTSPPIAG